MEVLESSSEGPIVQRPYLEGTRLEGGSSYSYPDTADRDTLPPSFFFFSKILHVYILVM
jgi:hypothetical protein